MALIVGKWHSIFFILITTFIIILTKDSEDDEFTIKKAIKKKDWKSIATQASNGNLRLSDIGKKCTQIPPKTYEEIFDKMFSANSTEDIENDSFEIEFNFDFFGQPSDEEGILIFCLYFFWQKF